MTGSLDREALIGLLDDLAERLQRRNVRAQVYIVGGAAMSLAFDRHRTTHDVDARIDAGHGALVEAVQEIARERGLPGTWLNEQATSTLPKVPDTRARTVYDSPWLTITGASAEHILAMKLESARETDRGDVETLVRHLNIRSVAEGMQMHDDLFPESGRQSRSEQILREALATHETTRTTNGGGRRDTGHAGPA